MYKKTITVGAGATVVVTKFDAPRMAVASAHRISVDGSVTIRTRANPAGAFKDPVSVADTMNAVVDGGGVDAFELTETTGTNPAYVTLSGD